MLFFYQYTILLFILDEPFDKFFQEKWKIHPNWYDSIIITFFNIFIF